MENMSLKEIKLQLNQVNKAELKELKLYILFLLSKNSESEGLEREEKVQLLKILGQVCGHTIKWPQYPEGLPHTNKPLFNNLYIEIKEFIEKHCKTIKRSQITGFMEKLIQLKFKAVEKKYQYIDVPLNQKSFLKDTTSLEAIVENSFPGYIQSGLISILYPKIIKNHG